MTPSDASVGIADLLWDSDAITVSFDPPFILAAGWASPVYVDCRRLIDRPEVRRKVAAIAAEAAAPLVREAGIEVIVGAETAGIPFAAWLADVLDLRLAYIRKHPLGIGRNAQVEGASVEHRRVLLVDDLTSDGTSKLAFARGLRGAGAIVEHALTIFYHDIFPGASERLRSEGLTLRALANWNDLLRADASARLSETARAEVERFRADPRDWSVRHGGRGASRSVAGDGTRIRRTPAGLGGVGPSGLKGFLLELIERDEDGAISNRRLVGQSGSMDEARDRAVLEIERAGKADRIVGYRIVNDAGDPLHTFYLGETDG